MALGLVATACSVASDWTSVPGEVTTPAAQPATAGSTLPSNQPDPNGWRPLGEPGVGGQITGLAIDPRDPDRVLVGGDLLGVGLSEDGGKTWQSTFGLVNAEMSRFSFHPTVEHEIWAATMGGPFVSFDGGRNWQSRRAGMPEPLAIGYSAPIEEILIDPSDPDRLLAVAGSHREWNAPGTSGWGVVWESTDHGGRWEPLATVGEGTNIVDATWMADGSLMVAALGRGLYRSSDGGRSWEPSSTGLPHAAVRELASHPTNASVAWVALGPALVEGIISPGGVWKSTDGGRNWQPSGNGLDLSLTSETKLGPNGSGQSRPVESALDFAPRYEVIVVAPSAPDTLLTSNLGYGGQAVFRSTDGGDSWIEVVSSRNFNRPATAYGTPISASAAVFDPQDDQRALIGNDEFVLATVDGGRRWHDLTSEQFDDGTMAGQGYSGLVANRIEFAPDGAELLLCGFDGANPLVSPDRGQRWLRPLAPSDAWGGCLDAAYSKAQTGRRYVLLGQAGIFGGVAVIEADQRFRVLAGAERGLPERYANLGVSAGAIEVLSTAEGTETVALAVGGVLYVSHDGASTFQARQPGLRVTQLCADPTQPGRLYVAGPEGMALSEDAGASFEPMAEAPKGAARLVLDAARGRLYATVWRTEGAGLWRWEQGNWQRLAEEPSVHDIAVDPFDPSHLLVATNDHPFHDVIASVGMLESFDDGATWQPHNEGLALLRVAAVAFDPARAGRAIIGTYGRGFFERTLPS